ncbi:hypothetical protein [Cellulosimicrobium sp. SL-1]|uniref:hypothetical protein n=1 Tax=Cellulosimicrobium sp. SL-1 TaxID=2699423 RepID=UPI0013D1B24B|nr:hypothetical protein [Cellulosimicrobium sp. SL-1]
MGLDELMSGLGSTVRETLRAVPEVTEDADPSIDDIPGQGSGRWLKIPNLVAVVFDLKGSTNLGTGRHDTSTARVYKSAVESAVAILNEFEAQFVDIQGDGGFGLFWGDLAYERALCGAVTVRTFSADLVKQLEGKFGDGFPETGFKVGVACGRVLVKQLGTPRNVDEQEAVWAGRPVNYAAKAAQAADRHEVIVTGSVWDYFESNDYVAYSCDCGHNGPSSSLWQDFTIDKLDGDEKYGRKLTVPWCEVHGQEFCEAIRSGSRDRDDVSDDARRLSALSTMVGRGASEARGSRKQRRQLSAMKSKRRG